MVAVAAVLFETGLLFLGLQMVTIYDIARTTGYSAPTISKALNGTGKLNPATREKIVKVAKDMGYEFNMAAKTLATKKSNLIGVVYEDNKMWAGFDHPLFGGVMNWLRDELEAAGYDIVFLSRNPEINYLDHAKLRSVDGVAIINPNLEDNLHLASLAASGIPCISTNDYIPGVCTVLTDNEESGYAGTEYLVNHGHTKIAFIAGPINQTSAAALERYKGFRRCLKKHNIRYNDVLFEECPLWDIQSGYDAFARLYRRTNDFTAIFAADDMLAFGVLQYAEEHNIAVPKQISLIGFDDDRISSFCRPRLTTFQQDKKQIAEIAAETLLFLIAGIPAPHIVRIPARLIERDSVRRL